ncbi:MAG: translation elongation factor Ts [Candidatus Omnitrophica bacterium]|nr:translation elongation factor Ts [Candidatus Omnitrophota bacterium]
MTEITPEIVKQLRDRTGAGVMDCKRALGESKGDVEKAIEILRKKGIDTAGKKASRETKDGLVTSYIHMGGKIGVLLEVNCETDFVARTSDFGNFVKDIAMQIAAASPLHVSREDVPANWIEKEKEIALEQIKGKPPQVAEKIIQGKLDKRYQEICLLEQNFIKDDKHTIKDILTAIIAKTGENIIIRRFVRFELGEK